MERCWIYIMHKAGEATARMVVVGWGRGGVAKMIRSVGGENASWKGY